MFPFKIGKDVQVQWLTPMILSGGRDWENHGFMQAWAEKSTNGWAWWNTPIIPTMRRV
jgi:hypothetical protein